MREIVRVHNVDNFKFINKYCFLNNTYYKINKFFDDEILCRNMSNLSEKVRFNIKDIVVLDKLDVPKLFR